MEEGEAGVIRGLGAGRAERERLERRQSRAHGAQRALSHTHTYTLPPPSLALALSLTHSRAQTVRKLRLFFAQTFTLTHSLARTHTLGICRYMQQICLQRERRSLRLCAVLFEKKESLLIYLFIYLFF